MERGARGQVAARLRGPRDSATFGPDDLAPAGIGPGERLKECDVAELSGAQILAKSLKTQGVGELFGLVGLPIGPITVAVQREGMRYIGVRHEQPRPTPRRRRAT